VHKTDIRRPDPRSVYKEQLRHISGRRPVAELTPTPSSSARRRPRLAHCASGV
jgi:hypothetical protein